MDIHKEFAAWAVAQGVKINRISAHRFPGRGLGIVAEKNFKAGDTLLTVPTTALRTLLTVPKTISKPIGKITVHGLLAATLALDTSTHFLSWRAILPLPSDFSITMPLFYPPDLTALLPQAASLLLANQRAKLSLDWSAVSLAFPTLPYDDFVYNWCLVNTRTFYFTSPLIRLPKPFNRDDCMALNPFADYFNHASSPTASASFSSSGYVISACEDIEDGDEIYISYGNHSNDFLLAEYGFILDENEWDEVLLDEWLLPMFSESQREVLKEEGFVGKWVLDSKGVCYRTKIAVRLLCMPLNKWRRIVSIGLEDGDTFEEAANEVLLNALHAFSTDVGGKFQALETSDCGLTGQRETLIRRWCQIRILIGTSIQRIES